MLTETVTKCRVQTSRSEKFNSLKFCHYKSDVTYLNEMVPPSERYLIRIKIKQTYRSAEYLKQHIVLSFFIYHLDNTLNSESLISRLDGRYNKL